MEEGQHPTETSRTSPGNSKRRKIVRSERITVMTTSASSSLWVHWKAKVTRTERQRQDSLIVNIQVYQQTLLSIPEVRSTDRVGSMVLPPHPCLPKDMNG